MLSSRIQSPGRYLVAVTSTWPASSISLSLEGRYLISLTGEYAQFPYCCWPLKKGGIFCFALKQVVQTVSAITTMCPDSLMTWYSVPSVQPTSSKGVQSGLCRNCVFLCIKEGFPVNFRSSGSDAPCFNLTRREMVCMLAKFPRVVTMQGNCVPKAMWISQEESPLGEEQRTVLPGQGAPAHGAPPGKCSLLWLLPGKLESLCISTSGSHVLPLPLLCIS